MTDGYKALMQELYADVKQLEERFRQKSREYQNVGASLSQVKADLHVLHYKMLVASVLKGEVTADELYDFCDALRHNQAANPLKRRPAINSRADPEIINETLIQVNKLKRINPVALQCVTECHKRGATHADLIEFVTDYRNIQAEKQQKAKKKPGR